MFGTVSHPHNQGAPDRSTTIGIVVVTDPEGVAAHLRDDGPTETRTAFFSLAHTNLPSSRSAVLPTNASGSLAQQKPASHGNISSEATVAAGNISHEAMRQLAAND